MFEVVSDGPHLVDGLVGGVVEFPVEVALTREHGAGVPASHGDDDVGGADDLVGPGLGDLGADVDADLGHGGDGGVVDAVGGFGAAGEDVDLVAGEVPHPSCRHLGSSGVVDAEEQDAGLQGGRIGVESDQSTEAVSGETLGQQGDPLAGRGRSARGCRANRS